LTANPVTIALKRRTAKATMNGASINVLIDELVRLKPGFAIEIGKKRGNKIEIEMRR